METRLSDARKHALSDARKHALSDARMRLRGEPMVFGTECKANQTKFIDYV